MDAAQLETTLAEADRLVAREERNLEQRLAELRKAEAAADSLRWQVINVERAVKELRQARNSLRNQELIDQIRLLHQVRPDGMCLQCQVPSPCPTMQLIEEETETE